MKKIIISLFVIASAMFLSSCNSDEMNVSNDINAKVDGYIFDGETNEPVSGAKVTISNVSATTNEAGYYMVSGLSTGSYPVKLEKEGYATALYVGAVTIDGANYYGDAIQTCAKYNIYPTNKTLDLTFGYQEWDAVAGEFVVYNVPQGLKVKVTYTSGSLIDQFQTYTTNSNGKITISDIAANQTINVVIDETVSADGYFFDDDITTGDIEQYSGSIRAEVNKYTVPAPGNFDIK